MQIDPQRQASVVTREVTDAQSRGETVHEVALTRTFAAPPDEVWSAVTDAERIPRWYLPITGDLQRGGSYQLEGNAGGEILECDPPRSFLVSWVFGEQVSYVGVRLRATGPESTEVRLEHVVPDDDHWRKFGAGAVGIGWEFTMLGLDLHLADPSVATDPAEFMTMMAAPDGIALVQASSAGWGAASVAGGLGATWAREAEARCTAAYTGQPEPQ
ncbi:polyketide cyclase [Epidermidibacterium keratini]|uniref:Polyketide cyclase n=1 Tax=Epidermidibacterium keratini TaxID=1891644 RepID=A0A7L4YN01_9ACTN|nr:SRPBCC family protein [Epidermidibacterium keratini]QHC00432.1 polyketide cyclase [Epidermidibacterium keratini]